MHALRLIGSVTVAVLLLLNLQSPIVLGQDLADVIAKAEKSVVRIEVESREGSSLGSGYIVHSSGVMVTNVHVMAGARTAVAIFPNGKKYNVKGTYHIDPARDICITQIDGKNFPVLPMAKDLPRKGEEVIALGSPQGLSFTATRGIVSAIRSQLEMARDTGNPGIKGTWVQVDAALSPGNSGGPIINRDGKLVAMSTLASFGQSQNLNFGISMKDVRETAAKMRGSKLTPLASGAAKVDMDEHRPESGDVVRRPPVPVAAIQEYVSMGKEDFDELTRELRRKYSKASGDLKLMKKGQVPAPVGGADIVRQHGQRNSIRYYFRTDKVKDREIRRQGNLVKELQKLKDSVGREPTQEALLSLLWKSGPEVDPRERGSVGFLSDARVIIAATEHDVIVDYDGSPYIMWVKDSSGLSTGQELDPLPVYVVGAKTIRVPGRGSIAVTILSSVLRTELEKAIFPDRNGLGSTGEAITESRTWRDKTGKFSVQASLIRKESDQVVLKTSSGEEIKVPLSKLSASDVQYLRDK